MPASRSDNAKRRKPPTRDVKRDQKRFLKALEDTGIVQCACSTTGIPRSSVYAWRKSDPAFRAAFKESMVLATELLEAEVFQRALYGAEEPVIWQGRIQMVGLDAEGNYCPPDHPRAVKQVPLTVRRPSDQLLMFVLKARKPRKYRDRGYYGVARKQDEATPRILVVMGSQDDD